MSLPPLSKVRCCRPKKIRATTGGIALHPSNLSIPTTLSKPHPPPCLTPPFQNRTIPSLFAMLTSVFADTLSHPHYPLPRTKLASLVKGEVLSPEKIRATTGGIALHPPASPSPQPSQTPIPPHQNSPSFSVLASGITTTPPSFSSSSTTPPSHS